MMNDAWELALRLVTCISKNYEIYRSVRRSTKFPGMK